MKNKSISEVTVEEFKKMLSDVIRKTSESIVNKEKYFLKVEEHKIELTED